METTISSNEMVGISVVSLEWTMPILEGNKMAIEVECNKLQMRLLLTTRPQVYRNTIRNISGSVKC